MRDRAGCSRPCVSPGREAELTNRVPASLSELALTMTAAPSFFKNETSLPDVTGCEPTARFVEEPEAKILFVPLRFVDELEEARRENPPVPEAAGEFVEVARLKPARDSPAFAIRNRLDSDIREARGSNRALTSLSALTRTTAPFRLPLYRSRSASVFASKCTTLPVMGYSVPEDHALGKAVSGIDCGSITWAKNVQRPPASKRSPRLQCALVKPHSASLACVHSFAR